MSVRNVLVVGAGIAGSTLAYWLARYGIDTTVVERAAEQRSSGSPVDVRGPALPVVEQMNLLAPLREAATLAHELGTHADEPAAALHRYEHAHRKRVGRAQRGVALASRMLVPATRAGIAVRNIPFRLWPVLASMRRIERPPG